MSSYKVPFDFTHEEKVFRWLSIIKTNVICNCKCNIIRNIIFHISTIVKTIIFLSVVAILMTFAFLKIGNIYADKYFFNVLKYIFRKKIFIFER